MFCARIAGRVVLIVGLRAAVSTLEFFELVSFRARLREVGRV